MWRLEGKNPEDLECGCQCHPDQDGSRWHCCQVPCRGWSHWYQKSRQGGSASNCQADWSNSHLDNGYTWGRRSFREWFLGRMRRSCWRGCWRQWFHFLQRLQEDECLFDHSERSQWIYDRWSRKVNCLLFRSIHDSICVCKRTLESGWVVPGGGACEVALNIHLENYNVDGKEQTAVAEFSEALNVIPKTLATNAAKDAT